MSRENPTTTPMHKLELTISHFLRGGVLFAGLLLALGWVWMLINSGDVLSGFKEYHPQSLGETLQWALIMNDRALLMSFVGLVILVMLPVIRVFMTGVLFLKQKDYRLAIMAFCVFFVLVGSFMLGVEL